MRKTFIILLIIAIATSAKAQYQKFTFGQFSYVADCFYNASDFITIKIKLASLDVGTEVEALIGDRVDYDGLINRLKHCKQKMIEWDSVCIKNNISRIDKLIEYSPKKKEDISVWFGKYYNSSIPLMSYDYIDGKSKIIIHTGKIEHIMNKYITCKGGVIIFYSPDDIQEMIDAFDLKKVCAYIDEKNKNASLLK